MAKLQHYVAQCYLRAFAAQGGKHPNIWCYDKVEKRAFKTNVKNVAGERYFYNSPLESAAVEEKLAELEARFVPTRQRIAETVDPIGLFKSCG